MHVRTQTFASFALVLMGAATLLPRAAAAEGPAHRRARVEIERELASEVRLPAPTLTVILEPMADPDLRLEALNLRLDGVPLAVTEPEMGGGGPVAVFEGALRPGRREVRVRLSYKGVASYSRAYAFTLEGSVRLDARPGLALDLTARVEVNLLTEDWEKRFRLRLEPAARMLVAVDTRLPPPAPAGGTPDAGATLEAAAVAGADAGTALEAPPAAGEDAGTPVQPALAAADPEAIDPPALTAADPEATDPPVLGAADAGTPAPPALAAAGPKATGEAGRGAADPDAIGGWAVARAAGEAPTPGAAEAPATPEAPDARAVPAPALAAAAPAPDGAAPKAAPPPAPGRRLAAALLGAAGLLLAAAAFVLLRRR